jgi:hypothetical protein
LDTTWWKNKLAVPFSLSDMVVGTNSAYFVILSTITRMLSFPFGVTGKSEMKSMEITLNGWDGIGIS